jgi:Spy/CpxP family protein refolding chaperone
MKTKQWSPLTGMIFMAVILAVPSAWAFGWGDKKGDGKNCQKGKCEYSQKFLMDAHKLLKEKASLTLTADQVKAIQDLKRDAEKNSIKQSAEIQVLELDIKAKLHEDKVDLAAVQGLIDQKYEIQKSLEKSAVEASVKLQSLLTDKQSEQYKKMQKECGRERKERNENRRGHGMNPQDGERGRNAE